MKTAQDYMTEHGGNVYEAYKAAFRDFLVAGTPDTEEWFFLDDMEAALHPYPRRY